MIRRLNVLETYGAIYNQQQAYNLCVVVRYPRMKREYLLQALKVLQKKEACLQVNYDQDLRFYPVKKKIPIQNFSVPYMQHDLEGYEEHEKNKERKWRANVEEKEFLDLGWLNILSQEVDLHFHDTKAPLIRINHLRHRDWSDIIFTFSHVIADGSSSLKLIQSFEEALYHSWSGDIREFKDSLPVAFSKETSLENKGLQNRSKAEVDFDEFDEPTTKRILKACKQNGTTLHGFLCAALAKTYYVYENPYCYDNWEIKVRSQVDLRPFIGSGPVIGNYQIAFDSWVKNGEECTVWDHAKRLRAELRENTKQQGSIQKLQLLADKINHHALSFETKDITISVSTLGVLPDMKGEILGAATSHYAKPMGHIKAVNAIIRGKLRVMLQGDADLSVNGKVYSMACFKNYFTAYVKEVLEEGGF